MRIVEFTPKRKRSLWQRVTLTADGCLVWTGSISAGKNGKPYGQVIWLDTGGSRRPLYTHRLVMAIMDGVLYHDLTGDVHHKCGNTLCMHPAHIEKADSTDHGRRHRFFQLSQDEKYAAYAAQEEQA